MKICCKTTDFLVLAFVVLIVSVASGSNNSVNIQPNF